MQTACMINAITPISIVHTLTHSSADHHASEIACTHGSSDLALVTSRSKKSRCTQDSLSQLEWHIDSIQPNLEDAVTPHVSHQVVTIRTLGPLLKLMKHMLHSHVTYCNVTL